MMTEKEIIKKYLGVPYKHQGRDLTGLDCYGLVIRIFDDLGIKLFDIEEDYTADWSWKGKNYFLENAHKDWQEVVKAKMLDVVGFKNSKGTLNHAGVMLDGDRFINSCRAGTVICRISDPRWKKRFTGFYRFKSLIPKPILY
jgi:cell wall-associated NlpC family hydrolase